MVVIANKGSFAIDENGEQRSGASEYTEAKDNTNFSNTSNSYSNKYYIDERLSNDATKTFNLRCFII